MHTESLLGTDMGHERYSGNISYYFDGEDDGNAISELNVLEDVLLILCTLCPLPPSFTPFLKTSPSQGGLF